MAKQQHLSFTFVDAAGCGNWDERPVLPESLDIQLTLSRSDRPQPFHLICQHDTVLTVMAGEGLVEFEGTSVLRHSYTTGDYIYVPAGTPHRIVPETESVHRYKLPESELEGVAWYCEGCGAEVHRDVWELASELPQEGYLRASAAFNAEEAARTCSSCGAIHPQVDTSGARWAEIVSAIRGAGEAKAPRG